MRLRAGLATCALLLTLTLSAVAGSAVALSVLTGCAAEPEPIIIETPVVTLTAYAMPEPTSKPSPTARPSPTPEAPTALPTRININTASARQLEALPRIGPATAQRIVEYRQAHGAFTSAEALMDVSGIGQATFDAVKDLITIQD